MKRGLLDLRMSLRLGERPTTPTRQLSQVLFKARLVALPQVLGDRRLAGIRQKLCMHQRAESRQHIQARPPTRLALFENRSAPGDLLRIGRSEVLERDRISAELADAQAAAHFLCDLSGLDRRRNAARLSRDQPILPPEDCRNPLD
jgi:hypothetical protein